MRFLVLGGDGRQKILAELLKAAGNEVISLYPGKATEEQTNADCVILPVPVEDGTSGMLYAPFCEDKHRICDIIKIIPRGSLVIGGRLPRELILYSEIKGIETAELTSRPDFAVGNAAITAEAAVSLLMQRLNSTLMGSRILIIGCGRIGKLLAQKLKALGSEVSVMSRSAQSRAMAKSLGMTAISPNERDFNMGFFDAIINTAPSPFSLPYESIKKDCVLLELASFPYGFDSERASEEGLKIELASALPGKYAPYSAARLIAECITNIVKERENGKA